MFSRNSDPALHCGSREKKIPYGLVASYLCSARSRYVHCRNCGEYRSAGQPSQPARMAAAAEFSLVQSVDPSLSRSLATENAPLFGMARTSRNQYVCGCGCLPRVESCWLELTAWTDGRTPQGMDGRRWSARPAGLKTRTYRENGGKKIARHMVRTRRSLLCLLPSHTSSLVHVRPIRPATGFKSICRRTFFHSFN